MFTNRAITPSTLSVKDLPWQILWDKGKCTLCGQCTAVCPVNAIELGVFRKRIIQPPSGFDQKPTGTHSIYYGIRQKTDPAYSCVGCAMCTMVCPNDSISPVKSNEADKLRM
ncbi:MAG TPA: 4Fe-4S dicluster domain-containing protein, partial [Desulfobacteraceae bacterium]|nr:4Fe-4S dicluster domain-containing protein [Desulfobacteraceae bacterium]